MSLRKASILSTAAFCVYVFALAPAQATADDTTLRAAGKSRDARFTTLGQKTRRAAREWRRSDFSRPAARRLLATLRATRAEIEVVSRAVWREAPSTPGGVTYKRLFFKSMASFGRGLRLDELGVRNRNAGKVRRANTYFGRARTAHRLAARYEREGIRAIEASG